MSGTYNLVAFSFESYSLAILRPRLNLEFYPLLVLDHLVPFAFLAPESQLTLIYQDRHSLFFIP
jgi:hypothetical protein